MFDKLVESTKDKRRGPISRILFMTGLIYGMLIAVIAVATIFGLNPGLAESYDVTMIAPPPPPGEAPPQEVRPQLTNAAKAPVTQASNVVPTKPIDIASLDVIKKYAALTPVVAGRECVGCVPGSGRTGVVFGGPGDGDAPVPPPPAAPKVKPTPEPTPEVKPTPKPILKVSSISPGTVLRRVTPQYSAIAKAAKADGAVQVQILISEEGRVLSAEAVGGHPLLRNLAVDAARQWLFKPTILNETPVKVQGILTFNFTLN